MRCLPRPTPLPLPIFSPAPDIGGRAKALTDTAMVTLVRRQPNNGDTGMRKWQCLVCGFIYEEERGLPSDGIAAGTRWEDIPEDWSCPDCGVDKSDFEMIEL